MATTLVFVTTVALVATGCRCASSEPPRPPAELGRALFMEHGCYGCHTLRGAGTPIANDLSHVGSKYSEATLAVRVLDPAVHQPDAHMPKLHLTEGQARALAAYLATFH